MFNESQGTITITWYKDNSKRGIWCADVLNVDGSRWVKWQSHWHTKKSLFEAIHDGASASGYAYNIVEGKHCIN